MAKTARHEEFEKTLSVFVPLWVTERTIATVKCPHCEGEFQVYGKRWREPLMSTVDPKLEINGRSCPYCMKVSLIPLDFFPKKLRAVKAALRG